MPDKQLVMPRPNEKQEMALLARARYVAYGGARGGGKSWFVRWKAILLCLFFAGIKVLITRKTYKELFNNHIAPLLALLGGVAAYNKTDNDKTNNDKTNNHSATYTRTTNRGAFKCKYMSYNKYII